MLNQNPSNPQDTLQKLGALLHAFGQMQQSRQVQSGGGQPGQAQSPVVSPARVTPLNIKYDASGAGSTMQKPQAQPMSPGYQPQPYGRQMMQGLDPRGQATFSAIQGVSSLLQNWRQRQDQKEQSKASNIAQNLMQAIESGDQATIHDIMNDKDSVKTLNKVYKGWLTKAQESKKEATPPDPAVSGFEAGIKQHIQQKGQGQGQSPQPSQAQPGQQQQQQRPQPGQVGGYQMPQSSPIQQLMAAKIAAENQAAKQDPSRLLTSQLTSHEQRQMQMIAGQLKMSPNEIEKIGSEEKITEIKSLGALKQQEMKDQAAYRTALTNNKGKENVASINAKARVDAASIIARHWSMALMMGVHMKAPSASMLMRLQTLGQLDGSLDDIISGKVKIGALSAISGNPFAQIQQQLKSAGLSGLAVDLPTVEGASGKGLDKLKQIKQSVDTYKKTFQGTLSSVYPGWSPDGSGSGAAPTPGPTPAPAKNDDPLGINQ